MDQHAWPADWESRTMLALTMHAQATGRDPEFLDAILENLFEHLNKKGYMGPVYADSVTHEQAMAGHSRMIRYGSCRTSNPKPKHTPELRIEDALLLPLTEPPLPTSCLAKKLSNH